MKSNILSKTSLTTQTYKGMQNTEVPTPLQQPKETQQNAKSASVKLINEQILMIWYLQASAEGNHW